MSTETDETVSLATLAKLADTFDRACLVWGATPLGEPRMRLLQKFNHLHGLLANYGAFLVMCTNPHIENPTTVMEAVDGIEVLNTLRLRPVRDRVTKALIELIRDGGGSFGGLANIIPGGKLVIDIDAIADKTKQEILVGAFGSELLDKVLAYDDVKLEDDGAGTLRVRRLTRAIDIALKAAKREAYEEILIEQEEADATGKPRLTDADIMNLEEIQTLFDGVGILETDARDWNFALNLYNGVGPVYLVNPVALFKVLPREQYSKLIARGTALIERNMPLYEEAHLNLAGKEMLGWESLPLIENAKRWGKLGGPFMDPKSKRDLTYDKRYPHEYAAQSLYPAVTALRMLDNGKSLEDNLEEFFTIAQSQILRDAKTPHDVFNIDLLGMGIEMCGLPPKTVDAMHEWDRKYGVADGTILRIHKKLQNMVLEAGHIPTHLYIEAGDPKASVLLALAQKREHGFVTIEGKGMRTDVAQTSGWLNTSALTFRPSVK